MLETMLKKTYSDTFRCTVLAFKQSESKFEVKFAMLVRQGMDEPSISFHACTPQTFIHPWLKCQWPASQNVPHRYIFHSQLYPFARIPFPGPTPPAGTHTFSSSRIHPRITSINSTPNLPLNQKTNPIPRKNSPLKQSAKLKASVPRRIHFLLTIQSSF